MIDFNIRIVDNDVPKFKQIAYHIRQLIVYGQLKPLEKLPAGPELAQALSVSLATVYDAYRLLQEDDFVVTRKSQGTRVSPFLADAISNQLRWEKLADKLLFIASEDLGRDISLDELIAGLQTLKNRG